MSDQGPMSNRPEAERKPTTTSAAYSGTGPGTTAGTAGTGDASERSFEAGPSEPWRGHPEARRREAAGHESTPTRGRTPGYDYKGRSNGESRSVIGTLRGLASDVGLLARQEAQLARTEIGEKVDQAKAGLTELGLGAALAYAGFLFVLLAAVFGLNLALERLWLSALIVGGAVHLIGLVMLLTARKNLKPENLEPKRTMRSLREDVEMARNETTRRSHV